MEFCCVLSFFMSEGDPQCCLIAEYPQPLFYCPGSGVISLAQTWPWVCTHKSRSCLDLQCLRPPALSATLCMCLWRKSSQGWPYVFARDQTCSSGSVLHSTQRVAMLFFRFTFPCGSCATQNQIPNTRVLNNSILCHSEEEQEDRSQNGTSK